MHRYFLSCWVNLSSDLSSNGWAVTPLQRAPKRRRDEALASLDGGGVRLGGFLGGLQG